MKRDKITIFNEVSNILLESNNDLPPDSMRDLYCIITETKKGSDSEFFKHYTNCIQHMLKYEYNPGAQSGSWLNTIYNTTSCMADIANNKSVFNSITSAATDKVQRCYDKAVERCKEEGNDISKYPKTIPSNMTISSVLNKDNINNFVNEYKSNPTIIDYLNNRGGDLYKR